MRRRLISSKVRKAFKQYTKDNCADRTLGDIRKEVGVTVGMSLDYGNARLFFDRQLLSHWQLIFKGVTRKRRRLRVGRATHSPLEMWEAKCMAMEHALSYHLRY